jgi:hypothetical protein
MSAYTVRVPEPRDAGPAALLHVEAWRETYAHLLPAGFFDQRHLEGRRRQWERVAEGPGDGAIARVAEHDGELVGLALAGSVDAQDGPRDSRLL